MSKWLFEPPSDILFAIITVVVLYIGMMIITRFFGLRTFADFTVVDFVSTVAIGSMLGIIILNDKTSLAKGLTVIVVVLLMQTLLTMLKRNSRFVRQRMTNAPMLLYYNNEICHENLKKFNLSEADLMGKLREANVKNLSEVDVVIFERNGRISVIHGHGRGEVDPKILEDVKR